MNAELLLIAFLLGIQVGQWLAVRAYVRMMSQTENGDRLVP